MSEDAGTFAQTPWKWVKLRAQTVVAVAAVLALCVSTWSAVTVHMRAQSRCVRIPVIGHRVQDARPGEWATIYVNGIERLRDDCGTPVIVASISNGDRVWHRAELGFDGRDLPIGVHNMSYDMLIDTRATPGEAVLELNVTFPNAEGGNQDPGPVLIPFTIKGERND